MREIRMTRFAWFILGPLVLATGAVIAAQAPTPGAQGSARPVTQQTLPVLDGAHLQASIVEVTYPPGAASAAHSHPCPVIGYVVRGAVRMQVKGEAEQVYTAGQSFFEQPNGVHQVSANASKTEPAVFLAYFVCDHQTALSVPPPSK